MVTIATTASATIRTSAVKTSPTDCPIGYRPESGSAPEDSGRVAFLVSPGMHSVSMGPDRRDRSGVLIEQVTTRLAGDRFGGRRRIPYPLQVENTDASPCPPPP